MKKITYEKEIAKLARLGLKKKNKKLAFREAKKKTEECKLNIVIAEQKTKSAMRFMRNEGRSELTMYKRHLAIWEERLRLLANLK